MEHSRYVDNRREGSVIRWVGRGIVAFLKPKALLVAENLCLRQQLIVLQRRQRPRLLHADRQFWIQARRWYFRLARRAAHCPARDGLEMAPRRVEGLLALALKTPAQRRPPADFGGAQGADPADGFREPLLGSAKNPSRAGEARFQGLCSHRSEIYAPALWREALTMLAAVSQATCAGYLGL